MAEAETIGRGPALARDAQRVKSKREKRLAWYDMGSRAALAIASAALLVALSGLTVLGVPVFIPLAFSTMTNLYITASLAIIVAGICEILWHAELLAGEWRA